MGRGAGSESRGVQLLRTRGNIHELAMQVIADVVKAFAADCVAAFPYGATLRVFDRKGGRRILQGDRDVTQLARRILFFTVGSEKEKEAWTGDPRTLVRLIARGLYGQDQALRCSWRQPT